MGDKIVPILDANAQYNILNDLKLILLKDTINLSERVVRAEKLMSTFRTIFSTKHTGKVFIYLLEHGACTAYTLQVNLDLSDSNSYKCLGRLKKIGLANPIKKIPKHINKKGGPRPHVWILNGATTDDVARAIRLHYRAQSPKYRVAEKIASTILTDYIIKDGKEEIGYWKLFEIVKENKFPYRHSDIAELAADYLSENGIKVFR